MLRCISSDDKNFLGSPLKRRPRVVAGDRGALFLLAVVDAQSKICDHYKNRILTENDENTFVIEAAQDYAVVGNHAFRNELVGISLDG